MDDNDQIRVTPRQLRALSHPLRTRMLGLLRTEGPATATSLGARLGESSGATSYHLRQLAAHGFIEEDPEHTVRGRERWWRAVHARTMVDAKEFMGDPETSRALDLFFHTVLDDHMQRVAAFVSEKDDWHQPWIDAADISDAWLRLTPERAKQLNAELHSVLDRYRDDASADSPEAEQVVVGIQLFPRRTS